MPICFGRRKRVAWRERRWGPIQTFEPYKENKPSTILNLYFFGFRKSRYLPLWTWRWKSSQRRRTNLDKWEKKIIDPRWFSCTIYWHGHCHDLWNHHHHINYDHQVDDVFLVVFPIMFLVLNLIYSNMILNIWLNILNFIYLFIQFICFKVFNLIYWPMCLSSRHGGDSDWLGQVFFTFWPIY